MDLSTDIRNVISIKEWYLVSMSIHYNLVTTTVIYMTPFILQHIFVRPNFLVQSSLSYMTLDNAAFTTSILSY